MQIIDAHRPSQRPRKLCAALTNALTLTGGFASLASFVVLVVSTPLAHAEAPRFAFAVIASTMQSAADEAPTQRLIDAIGRDRDVSFVVYDGNLKGAKEACRDALYERRHALLETSRPALFFIPGQHDWAENPHRWRAAGGSAGWACQEVSPC